MIFDATVVARLETQGVGPVTRLRVNGLPKNAACLRFLDVPGNSLKLGQKVKMTIEVVADVVPATEPVFDENQAVLDGSH